MTRKKRPFYGKKKRAAVALLVMLLALTTLWGCKSEQTAANGTQTESQEDSRMDTEAETQKKGEMSTQTETQNPDETPSQKETQNSGATPSQKETQNSEGTPSQKETQKPDDAPSQKQEEVTKQPTDSRKLQVIGTSLCDANGKPVQLRGISTHGLSWFPQYVNQDLIKEFHDNWNMNVLRLALYTAEYNGYCTGGNREELKALVKKGVQYATDNGMYVIIDWHVLNDDGNGMHANPNIYKNDAIEFFREMSSLYKDNPYVIYEICNEPNGGTTWGDIKSYANAVIPVIKANNPDAVIIVGTPTWSQEVDKAAADPITGYSNIMYALHFYAATHTQWLRDRMTAAVKAGLPVFVSEFGICDASGNGGINYDEASAWVKTMDSYGISYVMWNLSNKSETSSIIRSDVSKTSGFSKNELSDAGKWLYELLKK